MGGELAGEEGIRYNIRNGKWKDECKAARPAGENVSVGDGGGAVTRASETGVESTGDAGGDGSE